MFDLDGTGEPVACYYNGYRADVAVESVGRAPRPGAEHLLPLHVHCLFKQGIPLGELWDLGDLSRWLRKRGRYRFLFTAPPLRLPGAVGSPVSGVATV